jgi:ATP-dependent helicase Lhr and Lhr-like helicase
MTKTGTNAIARFEPLIQQWFLRKYSQPTHIQEIAWPEIACGEHLLITAPTGSGKTLTAFLWAINQFLTGQYSAGARVLYISPLKALNNDIERNLLTPLAELKALAAEKGLDFPRIRVQTRSGDTPAAQRRKMMNHPPEILITTPESLNLMLSSKGGQAGLGGFKTVILDEIHGVINSKRGVYLCTAVERLVPLCGEFQRIALSATVRPMNQVAQYIAGYERIATDDYQARKIQCLTSNDLKDYSVSVRFPEETANRPQDEAVWDSLAVDFVQKIRDNKATLLFVNSRALCEKLTYKINEAAEETLAYAHHGSLSKDIRTEVEYKLKHGELAAIVATSTLEMGIDIGHLDEVILVQSPDGISSAIQRIGRAGHGVGETSRCTIYPTHPTDFIEAAVLSKAVIERDIERIKLIQCPLDVLAQIIISMTGFTEWGLDELYSEIRRSRAYHSLSRQQFDLVINMLRGRYADNHIRELRPKVRVDNEQNTIIATPGALMSLYLSGGVIPDRGYFQLRHLESNARIGELDEEFVWEANVGKVFSLGTQHWQIQKITHTDVLVIPAKPNALVPPFWKSEGLNRDFHYAERVGNFLEYADAHLSDKGFSAFLQSDYFLQPNLAKELVDLLAKQKKHTHARLPHRHHLLIETTSTGPGNATGSQVILHTGWGSRVNRPLAMALEAGWQRKWQQQPEVWVSNECLVIQLPHHMSAREIFDLVPVKDIEKLLRERLEGSGFFGARFRENAGRALLLSKGKFNERKPLWMSRLQSQKLMDGVLKFEDFPILLETWRTCLHDEFDLDNLRLVLAQIDAGAIAISEIVTRTPSPFAQSVAWGQINNYMYADDQPKANKTSNLKASLLQQVVFQPGLRPRLPAELVSQFQLKRQRLIDNYCPDSSEELVEWLRERTAIPQIEWQQLLQKSQVEPTEVAAHITVTEVNKITLITARDEHHNIHEQFIDIESPHLSNWLQYYCALTLDEIASLTGIESNLLLPVLNELLENQVIIKGQLLREDEKEYWCDAENYESMLRILRHTSRVEIRPIPISGLTPFIFAWQKTQPGHQLDDITNALDCLRGLPTKASLWETELLPARVSRYTTQLLDLVFQEDNMLWLGTGQQQALFTFKEDLDLFAHSNEPSTELLTKQQSKQTISGGSKIQSGLAAELFNDPKGRYDFGSLLDQSTLAAAELADIIWQQVWQGKLSNDSLKSLRRGIETKFKIPDMSQTESQGRMRRSRRGGFNQWRSAAPFSGNWFQISYPQEPLDLIQREELNKDRVRILMDRYGIVFREQLKQELPAFQWRAVFKSLRLMELTGEIIGGYFFSGIDGLQFMTAASLRLLQQIQSSSLPTQTTTPLKAHSTQQQAAADTPNPIPNVFWINACDPASSCGLGLASLRGKLPRRIESNHLVYDDQKLVLISERYGKALTINVAENDSNLRYYYQVLRHLLYRSFAPLSKISIQTINGISAKQSPYLASLTDSFEVVFDHRTLYLQRSLDEDSYASDFTQPS